MYVYMYICIYILIYIYIYTLLATPYWLFPLWSAPSLADNLPQARRVRTALRPNGPGGPRPICGRPRARMPWLDNHLKKIFCVISFSDQVTGFTNLYRFFVNSITDQATKTVNRTGG